MVIFRGPADDERHRQQAEVADQRRGPGFLAVAGGVRQGSREEILKGSSSVPLSTPEGPGSVSGAPNLPAGFTDTFTSRYIDTGEVWLHAVIGGGGPPLLLVHGWHENWYAWRLLMPALARDFEVIAVDQRGIGLSDKPHDGYDAGTRAGDLVALMDALRRPAAVGQFSTVATGPNLNRCKHTASSLGRGMGSWRSSDWSGSAL